MWPYSKNKHFEIGEVKCPECGGPSEGYFEDGEVVMRMICEECKRKEEDKP